MKDQGTFRVRLRAQVGKPFATNEAEVLFRLDDHEVRIASQTKDQPLSRTSWIVFSAGDFQSEADARSFGMGLRRKLELAAAWAYLGADGGNDVPTSQRSEIWARDVGLIKPEDRLLPNMHGISVYPDDGRTHFAPVHAAGTMTFDPSQLLSALGEMRGALPSMSPSTKTSLRLLNLALMESDHLGRIILAFSAVEGLGQQEEWSKRQRNMIDELATELETRDDDPDRVEIASALRRGTHRLGLRQGVRRVLDRLDLQDLRQTWDRLYTARSGLVHGTKPLSGTELVQLAIETVLMCRNIVLRAVEREGFDLPKP